MKGFTSILSFPNVVVGNLSLFKKGNDNNGSPTKFLGDDNYNNRSRIKTFRDDNQRGIFSCCRFVGLRHYKKSVAQNQKSADKWQPAGCRLQGTAMAGFTLIELLVVILIIGILASVAWPNYQMAVERSRAASALAYGRAFRDSVDRYYMAHTRMPTSAEALDIGLKNCPPNFNCDFQYITTGRLYISRQNGPFWYHLVVRANASDWTTMQGTIYCAVQTTNEKGIQLCQTWGESDAYSDGWVRVKIEITIPRRSRGFFICGPCPLLLVR